MNLLLNKEELTHIVSIFELGKLIYANKLTSINNLAYSVKTSKGQFLIKIHRNISNFRKLCKEINLSEFLNKEIKFISSNENKKVEYINNTLVTCQIYHENFNSSISFRDYGVLIAKYHKKLKKVGGNTNLFLPFDLDFYIKQAILWKKFIENKTQATKIDLVILKYLDNVLLVKGLNFIPRHNQLIHGDFHKNNIITLTSGKPLLIDWECVKYKPRLCELAYFILSSILNKKFSEKKKLSSITDFISGYIKESNLPIYETLNLYEYCLIDRMSDLKILEKVYLEGDHSFNHYLYHDLSAIEWIRSNSDEIEKRIGVKKNYKV